ncbi:MAG TPA: hypothetical protein VFZ65_19495 [Planctomycetota bacterium]|nr:hypothetical protein [Planctomycetota bacterium]
MNLPERDSSWQPPDAWRDLDDTLADGPAPATVPDEARQWLGEQRFVHGLLRALHTADAAAREARIETLLDRIDHEARVEPRRRWFLVAAAAALLATFGVWAALPEQLPTAEAAVQRAVTELAREVHRRFRLEIVLTGANGKDTMRSELSLVTAPGKRFRLVGEFSFGSLQLGECRLGSDGEQLWFLPANPLFRGSEPLAQREHLMSRLGEVLDVGYLDVQELVKKLPEDFDLRVVGREVDAAGRSLLRIETSRPVSSAHAHLRSAWLLCDEESGMITRLEIESDLARGMSRRLHLEYLGEEPAGLVDYKRPW